MKKIPEVKTCPNCGGEFLVGGRGRPKRSQRFCSHHCQMTLANPCPLGHGSSAPRPKKNKDTLHNEEWLRWAYLAEDRSLTEIADLLDCTKPSVRFALRKFKIPIRSGGDGRRRLFDRRVRKWVGQDELIDAYGGKCQCCDESHREFLTLDHIGGGGNKHRASITQGNKVLRVRQQLKAAGWPKDKYRLLCMNCNFATRFGRICPHELARQMKCGKK